MDNRVMTTDDATRRRVQRALVACGFWLRVGFVGASAAAVGVIQLVEGEWSVLRSLVCAGAGVALTFLSWHRAHATLNGVDEPATMPVATPAAAHR